VSIRQGRCAGLGCGESGALKDIEWHVLSCLAWAALYQAGKDPLDPAAEYDRWREEDLDRERAVASAARVADTQARRARGLDRFRRRDILEDP